jgi:hypothetical protein
MTARSRWRWTTRCAATASTPKPNRALLGALEFLRGHVERKGRGSDVYCVYDPAADDAIALEAAVRLARALALASLRESSVQLDVPAVQEALAEVVKQQFDPVRPPPHSPLKSRDNPLAAHDFFHGCPNRYRTLE